MKNVRQRDPDQRADININLQQMYTSLLIFNGCSSPKYTQKLK